MRRSAVMEALNQKANDKLPELESDLNGEQAGDHPLLHVHTRTTPLLHVHTRTHTPPASIHPSIHPSMITNACAERLRLVQKGAGKPLGGSNKAPRDDPPTHVSTSSSIAHRGGFRHETLHTRRGHKTSP